MVASSIDVCSQALDRLGIPPISSFDDNKVAATCGRLYSDVINNVLARYPWQFARKYALLDRLTTAPPARWQYQHQLKAEMVQPQLYAVFPDNRQGVPPIKDFELVGNRILSNRPVLWASYSIRPAESVWPAHFYTLAIYALAAELALPITEDADKANFWEGKAYGTPQEGGMGGYFRTARQLDARQDPTDALQDFSLIEARFGGAHR